VKKERSHLHGLQLALLGAKLPSPSCFGLRVRLHARLELVNLLPPIIKLFPHLSQLLRESPLNVFTTFIKVKLDLAESFESRDQVVMEDAEVRERFGFRLTAFLLNTVRYLIKSPKN
jgi:hypothetical protein